MSEQPTEAANDDRDAKGRFAKGNQAAKGNPTARHAKRLRMALFKAVTATDLRAVIAKLVDMAKAGDVQAAKLLFDRLLGPPLPVDVIERLEAVEAMLREPEA